MLRQFKKLPLIFPLASLYENVYVSVTFTHLTLSWEVTLNWQCSIISVGRNLMSTILRRKFAKFVVILKMITIITVKRGIEVTMQHIHFLR